MKYPKIETLYKRGDNFGVDVSTLRLPEFAVIDSWIVTEKIDGMNIRVEVSDSGDITFGGRTDRAQLPATLVTYLQKTFNSDTMAPFLQDIGNESATLFGEGYGAKIQKGGIYRSDQAFRLFDVRVGDWWLKQDSVSGIASEIRIGIAPVISVIGRKLYPKSLECLKDILENSRVAEQDGGSGGLSEGIVARSAPMLFDRRGNRMMWKLKMKDFK